MAAREPWLLDKRVPIALIVTLGLQTCGVVWWVAGVNARVEGNTGAIERLDGRTEQMRDDQQLQAIQLGRIEEQIGGLRADVARLIRAIEAQ